MLLCPLCPPAVFVGRWPDSSAGQTCLSAPNPRAPLVIQHKATLNSITAEPVPSPAPISDCLLWYGDWRGEGYGSSGGWTWLYGAGEASWTAPPGQAPNLGPQRNERTAEPHTGTTAERWHLLQWPLAFSSRSAGPGILPSAASKTQVTPSCATSTSGAHTTGDVFELECGRA